MTILDQLMAHASRTPERTAFIYLHDDDPPVSITYLSLDRRARTLAARIHEYAKPGERALMLYPHGLEFIAAFLGCLYAGVVAVPAYPPRRNRSIDRLRSIVEDCRPRLVLNTREFDQDLDGLGLSGFDCSMSTDEIETDANLACSSEGLSPHSLAFLQYTSGSTAQPKGTMVSHNNLVSNERAIQAAFKYTSDTVMVSWLPLFHDMGLIGGVLQPLFVGFPSVLLAPGSFLREPIRWLRAVSDFGGTTTGAPNFAYDLCADRVADKDKVGIDLSSLTLAYNGAEPVRATTLERFAEAFACCGFKRKAFFPCYGMAETTLFTSGGPPQRLTTVLDVEAVELESHRIQPASDNTRNVRKLVGCGAPGEGTRMAIVDPETRRELARGEVGEIWIAGSSVAIGYWNRPEESAATFHAYTSDRDGPYLRSGDLGFLRAGELFVTGRSKDLIIIRGRNIYPQDVEAAVEEVADFLSPNSCAAFSMEHDGGEGLAIVLEANRQLTRLARGLTIDGTLPALGCDRPFVQTDQNPIERLAHRIRQRIAEHLDVMPIRVAFVQTGKFPRTSSGKLQRQTCKRGLESGDLAVLYDWRAAHLPATTLLNRPADDAPALSVHPLTERAITTANRWLRSHPDYSTSNVAPHTEVKSLGLDSLAITSLSLELEHVLGIRITPEIVFECGTFAALGQFLATLAVPNGRPEKRHTCVDANTNGHVNGSPGTRQTAIDHAAPGAATTFHDRLVIQNQRQREWRRREEYFFESEIESQSGSWVEVGGQRLLMMASYSYLGFVGHEAVNCAAAEAAKRLGTGAHGARLLAGTSADHRRLERELAQFMGAEDAIVYGSGYMANLATITALVGDDDLVIGDEWNHASIADGCAFSRATFKTFRHNDIDHLELLLAESSADHKLVVVDAVYSMEGDIARLPEIVSAYKRNGAMLMVDEAHSLGVLGQNGLGVQEHFDLPPDAIDLKMGTLSKTFASYGGFIAARSEIIDYLKHHARGFIFSAALPAPQVAAARECLKLLQAEPERVKQLRRNALRFVAGLQQLGFRVAATESAIVPILFDDEDTTLQMVKHCRQGGLFVVPVFYPAVPMNAPRIRATVMATHTDEEIDFALAVIASAREKVRLYDSSRPMATLAPLTDSTISVPLQSIFDTPYEEIIR